MAALKKGWPDKRREQTMARKRQTRRGEKAKVSRRSESLADQAVALADYAAKALVTAARLGIQSKSVSGLRLQEGERAVLTALSTLPAKAKKKLAKPDANFSVAEIAGMTTAMAECFPQAEPKRQTALLLVAKRLMDCLQKSIVMPDEPAKTKTPKSAAPLYQFKITLMESQPPIWRRIQVKDCTLDKLHEHIQTAMGWTNSHLHHFKVNDRFYGDPMLMEETFGEMEYEDSTATKLSDILPTGGKRTSTILAIPGTTTSCLRVAPISNQVARILSA
jgi:Plasmid pRiA4b ORF-3-like protein